MQAGLPSRQGLARLRTTANIQRSAPRFAQLRATPSARPYSSGGRTDEAGYLDVLVESLEAGAVQADRLLALYRGAWGGRLDPVYEAVSY